jgi:NADH-quinone oxidoreductase subunit A
MSLLAAYALLFVAIGAGFIFVHLVAGWLIRPSKPGGEKDTIYECGEPTIGSAWIQFDLRFYVVALLFVIFDVEVAFLFPWAEVFGKANAIANAPEPTDPASAKDYAAKVLALSWPSGSKPVEGKAGEVRLFDNRARYREVLKAGPDAPAEKVMELVSKEDRTRDRAAAQNLAWLALGEVVVFFGVLLVGFAYLWKRGDLAWVRSVAAEQTPPAPTAPTTTPVPAPARAMARV